MNWNVDTPEGLANAIEWMEKLLPVIKDGGTWAVPRSGSIIQLDKVNKRAVRLLGLALSRIGENLQMTYPEWIAIGLALGLWSLLFQ